MTAEEAREIYHVARLKAMNDAANYSQPVVQDACDLAGWAAVIKAILLYASPYNDHMR